MADLISCSIIERDSNEDIIWATIYPSASSDEKLILSTRFLASLSHKTIFSYGRIADKWFYMTIVNVENGSCFAIILVAKEFGPEKYSKISNLLARSYSLNGPTANVIAIYLKLLTTGTVTGKENGTQVVDFNIPFPPTTLIKDLIRLLGVEIIVIYTALLLKRRLLIYHHDLNVLLQLMPTFFNFLSHRKQTDTFFPWIDSSQADISLIKNNKCYIAGCCEQLVDRESLYDVYVNIPAREIIVATHAKDGLPMTKIHKDIAMFIQDVGEGDHSEAEALAAINGKTEELFAKIRSFSEDNSLTIDHIKDKMFSANAEKFLIEVAKVENLLSPQ